jgi:ribonuclease VapC
VDELLGLFDIEIVPISQALTHAAVDAFDRFGKGRHPARLNLADCFSYALAKSRELPLLFKGDDFSNTDLTPAWRP